MKSQPIPENFFMSKINQYFPNYIIFSNNQGRPQRGDLVWRGNEPSQWMLDRKIYVSCFSLDSNFPFIQPALIPPYNRTEAIILVLLKNLNLCQTQLMKMPISVFSPHQSNSWLPSRPTKLAFPPKSEIKSLEIALTPHLFKLRVLL